VTLRVTPSEIVSEAERSGSPGLLGRAPHWDRVMLGDVARVVNGAAFSSRLFNGVGRGLPLIRIRDVDADNSSTWYEGPFEHIHEVNRDDVLVGMDGDFRAARWRGPRGLLNQRVCRLDVNEDLYDSRFLLLVLQGYLDAIWKHTSSVTVKHLSSRSVAEIPLPRPELLEQRRIVEILEAHLSRLDSAVATIGTATRRLRRMRAAFGDQLWKRGWPPEALRLLTHLVTDGDHNPPKRVSNGVPHITAKGIRNGAISLVGCTHVSEEGFRQTAGRYEPMSGDVIVSCVGTIGQVAVVPPGLRFSADRNLAGVRVDPGRLLPHYLALALDSHRLQQRMNTASSSTAQPHLYLQDLRNLPIPIPDVPTQAALVAAADDLEGRTRRLTRSATEVVRQATSLRRSLLAAAFAGRLGSRLEITDV